MGGLVRASEIPTAGWLLRGDSSSEIGTFSIDILMLKPAGLFIVSTCRHNHGQAFPSDRIGKFSRDTACFQPPDPPFLKEAILIRVARPFRAVRWRRACSRE